MFCGLCLALTIAYWFTVLGVCLISHEPTIPTKIPELYSVESLLYALSKEVQYKHCEELCLNFYTCRLDFTCVAHFP